MPVGIMDGKVIISDGDVLLGCCDDCGVWVSISDGAYSSFVSPYVKLTSGGAIDYPSTGINEHHGVLNPFSNRICYDGQNMWMVSSYNGCLTKIDLSDLQNQVITDKTYPKEPMTSTYRMANGWQDWASSVMAIAFANGFVWTISKNNKFTYPDTSITSCVNKTNISDPSIVVSYSIPFSSQITDIVYDGKNIWISRFSGAGISLFDTSNNDTISNWTVPVGLTGPRQIQGMAWDGTYMWCSCENKDLIMLNASGSVIAEFLGTDPNAVVEPRGLVWDGTYMWVTGYSVGGSISKFEYTGGSIVFRSKCPCGGRPTVMTKAGNNLYIIGETTNQVLKFDLLTNVFVGPPPDNEQGSTTPYYTCNSANLTTGITAKKVLP